MILLFFVLFLRNLNITFLLLLIIHVRVSTYMTRYRNKDLPQLAPQDPTARRTRISIERGKRLSNRRVLCVGGGEARKGKELGKGEVKDNPVSEGDRKHTMLLRDLSEEGPTKVDQEGEEQEGDEEEGESCNRNCDVTGIVFSCSIIYRWFY